MTTFLRNPNAKWLPSRHRHALARLVAFVILSRYGEGSPSSDVAYIVNRDQSAVENYAIATWVTLTVACYLAPFVTWWLALPAALVAIQIPMCLAALIVNNRRATSVVMWTLLAAASAFGGWVGRVFFVVLGANAVAYIVMFALRHRVREMEQRCGA